MTPISALRDGLKTRLSTISGLRAYDTIPGDIRPPAAVVRVESINYSSSMGGLTHEVTFNVLLLVSTVLNSTSQDTLDGYLNPSGSTSVLAAIDAGFDLGGICDGTQLKTCRNYGQIEYAGTPYIGAELVIEVLMS